MAGDEDPLASPFYQDWRRANPQFGALSFDQAIGYKVPPFLGGEDVEVCTPSTGPGRRREATRSIGS